VKGLYVRTTQKGYVLTRKSQLGDIKEVKNRKIKKKKEVTVLLLCLTSTLQPVLSDLYPSTCRTCLTSTLQPV